MRLCQCLFVCLFVVVVVVVVVVFFFFFFFFSFFSFFFAGGQTCIFYGKGALNLDVRTLHLGCLTRVVSVLY